MAFRGQLMGAAIQGAQNTSRQELAQRQALFQNLVGAMDDGQWLMQHFPDFWGWNSTGGGGGGYEAGTNAPIVSAAGGGSSSSSSQENSDWGLKQKPATYSQPDNFSWDKPLTSQDVGSTYGSQGGGSLQSSFNRYEDDRLGLGSVGNLGSSGSWGSTSTGNSFRLLG